MPQSIIPHPVPLTSDPELKKYLADLPTITKKKDFDRWRNSFLTKYETFLGSEGVGDAGIHYNAYVKTLSRWSKMLAKVQTDIEKGNLTVEKCTASARTRLIEFQKQNDLVSKATFQLTPTTVEMEKKLGYTKFQLGALLVRDGFDQYTNLATGSEILKIFRHQSLKDVSDRQLLDSMVEYQTKFEIFCDIMADLGLYNAMLKCHELNQLPPEPDTESEPEPESESEESLQEPPPKSPVPIKEKAKKEVFDPYSFKLDMMGIKPPSGPFIKFVDTGATKESEVQKGIHQRGKLSSTDLNYNHSFNNSSAAEIDYFDEPKKGAKGSDYEVGCLSSSDDDDDKKKKKKVLKKKPAKKSNFNVGYHGGSSTDDWRISKGKVQTSGKSKSFTPAEKKKATTVAAAKKKKADIIHEHDGSQSSSSSSSSSSSDDSD